MTTANFQAACLDFAKGMPKNFCEINMSMKNREFTFIFNNCKDSTPDNKVRKSAIKLNRDREHLKEFSAKKRLKMTKETNSENTPLEN